MKTVSKILTLAAASAVVGVGAFATTPASAFNSPYDDQRAALSNPGWVDYDQDYYGPARNGWNAPYYGVTSGTIAVCPPTYHLGRSGALCWPD